jgi:hypothetical protein
MPNGNKLKHPYDMMLVGGDESGGVRAVTIWGDEGWTIMSGNDKERPDTTGFYSARVPIVFRGMQLRADGVASIPFSLVDAKSGDEKDTSDDWQNECGFLPDPESLFWLLEAARTVSGEAYIYKSMNRNAFVKVLRVLAPASIKYNLDKNIFVRAIKEGGITKDKIYPPALDEKGVPTPGESIVACWMDDPDVEKGQPLKFPAKAALSAMGVLFNLDESATGFFKRGMLHTYAFQVPPGTQQRDKEELEDRVKNFLTGVRNQWRTILTNIELSKPVDLGGGLEELANVPLVKEERENVSIALGVPYSKLFSQEARGLGGKGVVDADDRRLIKDTCLPEWKAIARDLNEQIFVPAGYRLVEHHESMNLFQENETDRSTAIVNLTTAFTQNPEIALIMAQTMGLNIDDDTEAKLQGIIDAKKAEPPAPVAGNPAETPNNPAAQNVQGSQEMNAEKMTGDLDKWKRKALKAIGKAAPFESDFIPINVYARIVDALPGCKTAEDVRGVFAAENGDMINTASPNQLVEMMRLGVKALEAQKAG